jgi:hypothetical protein
VRQRLRPHRGKINLSSAKGSYHMKTLSLAALALAALMFAAPVNGNAGPLRMDGLQQDSLVQTVASKKKKKKYMKKKKKKKYVKKGKKKYAKKVMKKKKYK